MISNLPNEIIGIILNTVRLDIIHYIYKNNRYMRKIIKYCSIRLVSIKLTTKWYIGDYPPPRFDETCTAYFRRSGDLYWDDIYQ